MDYIASYLPDQVSLYYYLAFAFCGLGLLYLNDAYSKMKYYRGYNDQKMINYGYQPNNGPDVWRNLFAEAGGRNQSPINLVHACSITIPSDVDPLVFSKEFSECPYEMKLYNSGLNAVLYAKWCGSRRPTLTGGPLECDEYTFLNLRFRWGPTDEEGSEHMVSTDRYAAEMQVAFMKNASSELSLSYNQCDILDAARNGNLLMLSYLISATPVDNPYFEPLIQALRLIKLPGSCASLCPFPLKFLAQTFDKNYFCYEGSLTFPPCTEGVKWIVQPEPLVLSSGQLRQFRKLGGCAFTPLVSNSRPVQINHGREIYFYS